MIVIEQIREKLIEAIDLSGMKKIEIAALIKVNPTQISAYVKGSKMPSLETFANLCKELDLDANEILCIDKRK